MIQMGTVPQEVCMETIRQWGEKIIPSFRSIETGSVEETPSSLTA
jgi:hypothetical protein